MAAVASATMATNGENDMRTKILAIMTDKSLTDEEKGRKRQELLMGRWAKPAIEEEPSAKKPTKAAKETGAAAGGAGGSGSLDENLKCTICMNLCERPVTAPCQHNFCLGCFNKWHQQGKKTCPTCRAPFPAKFAQNPRINTALTFAIRLAKNPVNTATGPAKDYHRIDNESRPDEAFKTERAVRNGRANAASGRIMVTTPNDHFGPIGPEFDPTRSQGVLVGEWWKDRLDCRQWGAHFPHVAGIAGQSGVGAQSVVLSGGYEDDKDEGEWFLYTGSGGRDLSGTKRTNKVQSFDQEFENMNKALKLSCIKGLPVRVVRSFKEKRSSYAPTVETPVRYDGIYRILRCWRKPGNQKHLICRYLFVRCDNSPAPWITGDDGDRERMEIPKEAQEEIKQAKGQVFEMAKEPMWAWLEEKGQWGWATEAPESQQRGGGAPRAVNTEKKLRKKLSEHEKALKEFKCLACHHTLNEPLRTPCGHNFCRGCLEKKFQGISDVAAPNAARENLRIRRNLKPCPACKADLCDFLSGGAQVNREMVAVIQKLQEEVTKAREEADRLKAAAAEGKEVGDDDEDSEGGDGGDDGDQGGDDDAEGEEVEETQEEDGAGPSGTAVASNAGFSSAPSAVAQAVPPSPCAAPSAAPPIPPLKEKYSAELATLTAEFPDFDRDLLKSLLEDQAGDLLDVRAMLRMTKRPARKVPTPQRAMGAEKVIGKDKKRKAEGGLKLAEEDMKEEAEAVKEEDEEAAPKPLGKAGRPNASAKRQKKQK